MKIHTNFLLGLLASLVVGLKLVLDLISLPSNFEEAKSSAETIQTSYALDFGRTQLDGSRLLRFSYQDANGSTYFLGCHSKICDGIAGMGNAKVVHIRVAMFIPTSLVLSIEIQGFTKYFPNALSEFRSRLLGLLIVCIVGFFFSLIGYKVSK